MEDRRLDSLIRRPEAVIGDSEDFVELDWSASWRPHAYTAHSAAPHLTDRTRRSAERDR